MITELIYTESLKRQLTSARNEIRELQEQLSAKPCRVLFADLNKWSETHGLSLLAIDQLETLLELHNFKIRG